MTALSGIQTYNPVDSAPPKPPYAIEIKRFDQDRGTRFWQLVQYVNSLDEGLSAVSKMCSSYQYRLYLGAEWGYLYLDYEDDPDDADYVKPVWKRMS